MDLLLKSCTKLSKSPKNFIIPAADFDESTSPKDITLNELQELDDYSGVNVDVKIMSVGEVQHVGVAGPKKQDVIIADSSGLARLTLWEKDTDSLREQQCYHFTNFLVREFNGRKYLVMTRYDSTVQEIPEISCCKEFKELEPEPSNSIKAAKIIAVLSLETHNLCFGCKARVEPGTPPFGRCSQCYMTQLYETCSVMMTAKLLFMTKDDEGQHRMHSLLAQGTMLEKIIGRHISKGEPIRERELLSQQLFTEVQYYCNSNIINSVSFTTETAV